MASLPPAPHEAERGLQSDRLLTQCLPAHVRTLGGEG
jgi:hypothetical protein